MPPPADNTTLSRSARLLLHLGPPAICLLTSLASPKAALISPLTFAPSAWFLKKWHELNKKESSCRGELEPLLWTYASVGTIGLASAAVIQIAICKAATVVLFGTGQLEKCFWTEFKRTTVDGLTSEQLAHRHGIASSWQNWVFNIVFTFAVAGFVEETLKYLPILYARHRDKKQKRRRNRGYIDYALASALGFGLVEAIGFVYGTCTQDNQTWSKILLTLVERVAGQLGHLSIAALTALRATRRDFYGDKMGWLSVVGPSIFWHGTFNFVAVGASTLEGNIGFIHPTGRKNTVSMLMLAFVTSASAAWQTKQEWEAIESRVDIGESSRSEDDGKKDM